MPPPPEDKFRQQKLDMWQPIMTPWKVITIFLAIGIAFVPAGVGLLAKSNNIYESTFEYDDGTSSSSNCKINSKNKQSGCDITFTIRRKIDEPLYVYYELTNFYQNHRRYVNSRNVYQLQGQDISKSDLALTCDPTTTSGNMTLNPCGLIANSFFNDIITLSTSTSSPAGQFSMDESNIAWDSDKDKFKQVSGFEYQSVACNNKVCDPTVFPNGCKFYDASANECYAYYYPNDDTVKYLYESYPEIISPIEGVTNEHFMVWMRTAALPTFRKLYGKIDGPFVEGDILKFKVFPYFEVDSFDGTKSIVISTLNDLGGKNPYLGVAYIVVGSLSLLFGVLFAVKQVFMPRNIGGPELLRWT